MGNTKVTYKQLILLLFTSRIMLALTHLPALTTLPKNQDVWISEIISMPFLILLSLPVYFLWKRFPDKSIIQYSKIILGKAGILIGFLVIYFFMDMLAINLGLVSEFLTVAIYQEAPRLFFIVTMVIACCYLVYMGFETMGRTSEIIAIIIVISVVGITFLLLQDIEFENLKPIMEKGIVPVLIGGLGLMARVIEILGLAMVLPSLNDSKKAIKVFIGFFSLSTFVILLVTIPILTIWGVEAGKNSLFPYFNLIKVIGVGDFIERIDVIHMGIWVMGYYIRISFYFYIVVLGISQIFNFSSYKPFILPIGSILVPLTVIVTPSIIELRQYLHYKTFIPYSLFFIVLIPSLLLVIAVIRKKGEKIK